MPLCRLIVYATAIEKVTAQCSSKYWQTVSRTGTQMEVSTTWVKLAKGGNPNTACGSDLKDGAGVSAR